MRPVCRRGDLAARGAGLNYADYNLEHANCERLCFFVTKLSLALNGDGSPLSFFMHQFQEAKPQSVGTFQVPAWGTFANIPLVEVSGGHAPVPRVEKEMPPGS